VLGPLAAQLAAEVAQLDRRERELGVRAGHLDEGVERVRRKMVDHEPVAGGRNWLLGVHVHVAERRHLDGGDRVVQRPERAQRREQLVGVDRVAEVVGLDDRERLATDRFGDLRDRREVQEPTDGGQLVRQIALSQLPRPRGRAGRWRSRARSRSRGWRPSRIYGRES
jgi:hypothetical protein